MTEEKSGGVARQILLLVLGAAVAAAFASTQPWWWPEVKQLWVPKSGHAAYSLPERVTLTSSGGDFLRLRGNDAPSAGGASFFTASSGGTYDVSVATYGPSCPSCYTFVVQLYKAESMPGEGDGPVAQSAAATSKKDPNWHHRASLEMKPGEKLWLMAWPCGDEHCRGSVSAAVDRALVEVVARK